MNPLKIGQKDIQTLCGQGEKVIESEPFYGVYYLIKEKNIVILSGKCGALAVALDRIPELTNELWDIYDTWKDIDTVQCPTGERSNK